MPRRRLIRGRPRENSLIATPLALLPILFTAQAPAAKPASSGKVEVLWLGQSAVRISTPGGKVIGERYRPDLVLIPIGGHFVMSPEDAAYATREWLTPKFALPWPGTGSLA